MPGWKNDEPSFRGSIRRTLSRWRKRIEPRIVVLMYHRVADLPCDPWDQCVTPEHFDEQLEILKREVDVIPASRLAVELEQGAFGSRAAVITFDDGYADNLTTARPLLERHGLPATFFLTAGMLNCEREFWWDDLERIFLYPGTLPDKLELAITGRPRIWSLIGESDYSADLWAQHRAWRASYKPETVRQRVYYAIWKLLRALPGGQRDQHLEELAEWAHLPRTPRPTHRALTMREARQLASRGRFDLGAHTISHTALSGLPDDAQDEEIRQSKASIESLVQWPVQHFAFPYGDYSAETMTAVRDAGFSAAFTTRSGVIGRRGSQWRWPRCKVYDWNGEQFSRRLAAWFGRV